MRFKEFLLQEADNEDVEYPPFREIVAHLTDEMEQIQDEYEKHVTKGDSVPAGPDTTK